MPDGPWRVANTFHLIFDAGNLADAAWAEAGKLASRLDQGGVPISRFSLVGATAFSGARRQAWPVDFPAAATGDIGSAIGSALGSAADCLVVQESVSFEAAAVLELRRVADTDPMIAGVSPRFFEDALCSSAAGPDPNAGTSAEIARSLLPVTSYVPLPDRRCLYLKGSILAQFRPDIRNDGIDWDDYALSINRYGLRMVVANHAGAHAAPGRGAAESPKLMVRGARLERSYQGARSAMASFLTGTPRAAERLLAGLVPDEAGRREIAFDLTHLGPTHSGTAQLARTLIRRAAASWSEQWNVTVIGTRAAYDFHFADALVRPKRIEPDHPRTFAAFIRIGQPFSWKDIDHAVRRAPAIIFFMLDTIGLDCIRLAPDELDAVWRFTLAEADGLLFNSAFTQRQFERRFAIRENVPRLASLHSLRLEEYDEVSSVEPGGKSVLILGNGFSHKYVEEASRLLAAADPAQAIVALGPAPGSIGGVTSFLSGSLDPQAMSDLYGQARVVVYPSIYEGFGFPLLEALAHRRPVLVRALAPFAEIAIGLPEAANMHVFETDADLVRLVASPLRWTDQRTGGTARGWDDCTADLLHILEEALSQLSYDRVLRRVDFMRGRMEWIRGKRFRSAEIADEDGSGDDVERLAGLAGRIGQDFVLKLGHGWPAEALLGLANRLRRRGSAG